MANQKITDLPAADPLDGTELIEIVVDPEGTPANAAATTEQIVDLVGTNTIIDEDSFASDTPTQAPSQQSTKAYIAAQIATNVGAAVLIWDDVDDYEPEGLKDASVPKEFRGPTDPNTITGVVLNPYDTWIDTGA